MPITFQEINENIRTEQVLAAFDIIPDASNKVLCPVHKENEPSALVNAQFLFCFGCKRHLNNFDLAQILITKKRGKEATRKQVFNWFERTKLPEPSKETYGEHKYIGPVPIQYINYWADDCMVPYSYQQLYKERLITEETARKYKIGWRPDFAAWTIPFFRGEPGKSDPDIIQFRMTTCNPKYMGMSGHNRGSVMNAHLLEEEQPYLAVLFGAFDAILALQDGVLAVGLNGSMPFRKDEKARVQKLFEKQTNVIVVPDNTPAEFSSAYKFAEWVGGRVRFFTPDLPADTDYIDYRKLGHWAIDFKQDVLELSFPYDTVLSLVELLKVGDPKDLAKYHAFMHNQIYSPDKLVNELSKYGPLHYSKEQWNKIMGTLRGASNYYQFFNQVEKASQLALEYTGEW